MTDSIGTSGNDSFAGDDDADTFDMTQGGKDTVTGGGGSDYFAFGATLTAGDRIDGGDGFDILSIQGDYSEGLTLGANTLHGIERIQFLAGFDYRLTLVDGNIDPGTQLDLSNDHGANSIWVDASAIVNGGSVFTYSQQANTIIGSQSGDRFLEFTTAFDLDGQGGDDTVQVYGGLDRHSRFDGGAGADTVQIFSEFSGVLRASQMKHVEALSLFAASDITFSGGNVAAGATLTVNVYADATRLDASAETTGHYGMNGASGDDTLIGGRGQDTLNGGSGDDVLTGGKAGDQLTGGDGADSFIFTRAGDSTKKAADLITDFNSASDHIDLSLIDARTDKAGDQAFHLVANFTHAAGQLVLTYDADANITHVQGDVNGDGRADIWIDVVGQLTDVTGFVL